MVRNVVFFSIFVMDKYNFPMYAVFAFLSRVVLKRLNCVQMEKFRKVERSSKIVVKAQADIADLLLYLPE